MKQLKIVFDEKCIHDALELRKIDPYTVVSCYGFDGIEREVWENAVRASLESYQHLRSLGVKHQYASSLLPLATLYRHGNRGVKRPVQTDPVRVKRLPGPDDNFEKGMGI